MLWRASKKDEPSEYDRLKEIRRLMGELREIKLPMIESQTFSLPLPSSEWEEFEGSEGKAKWKRLPTKRGRKVVIHSEHPFEFGHHSHPVTEHFELLSGACLFGSGKMQYMEAGDRLTVPPNIVHSMRVLRAGRAEVYWPDLEEDEIEISAQ